MKHQRWIRLLAPLGLAVSLASFAAGTPAPDTTVPAVGQKAGKITALLPTAHLVRGAGKKAVTTDAVKGEDLIWQDLVKTDKGGRARITLNDQSILSLGSQAELRIVKHDARTQQTALEMRYGRIRAQVVTVTREGGSFSLRTPTAVAGVIGTDFGTDASEPGVTTFVCISGMVQVGNADPAVPGTVPCAPGQTTTVKSGMPPTAPQPATQQQINQLITDTEPATISAFAPASALIGTTLDAVATGRHMSGFNGVSVAGAPGVEASLGPNGTDTSATAHLVVASSAQPGPRTITFTKPNGANTAAVFTVIAPPSLQAVDAESLKKRYTDILTAELEAADAANGSFKSSLQQEVDQGLQTLQQNNGKLPQPISTGQLSQQLANLVASFTAAGTERETQAYNTAGSSIDAMVAAMLPKIQDGTEPSQNIATDLDKQFATINQAFQATLSQIHADFAAQASTQIQSVDQLVSGFEQNITQAAQQQSAPPTLKVDSEERTVEAGFPTSFDASGSMALGGANIASVSWVLCDSSYKPSQVGIVLPQNTSPCKAISGFAASGGQFQFNTCSLAPADYVARVTVTDTNGQASAMDVRVHVTQPGYDDPATRLQGLAAAYVSLQSQQFLGFFDPSYAGFTQLQENIRNTFLNLSSMQINLRVSQANVTCNEATLRADWDQKYTFKNDPTCASAAAGSSCQKPLFSQTEQLTARMVRVPGRGWFITDFQGDNGTVQGVPPGPQTVFAAPQTGTVDLEVGAIAPVGSYIGTLPGAVDVTITNVGTAPSSAAPDELKLTSSDFPNFSSTADLPALQPAQSAVVRLSFSVPNSAGSHPINVAITPAAQGDANPANDSAQRTLDFTLGSVDLQIGALSLTQGQPPFAAGETHSVSFAVNNAGNVASSAGSFSCQLTNGNNSVLLGTGQVPALGAGLTSSTLNLSFTVPASTQQVSFVGTSSVTCSVAPDRLEGGNQLANNTASIAVSIHGSVNPAGAAYAITSIVSATTPNPPVGGNAFEMGQVLTVQITVANTGTASPTGNITLELNCTGSCQFPNPPTATIAAPVAGQSGIASITIDSLQLPPATGYVGTATIISAPPQSSTAGNTASIVFDVTDFGLQNTLNLAGDLNVQVGSQGLFNVSLTEPAGLTGVSIPVSAGPALSGVSYALAAPFAAGSSNPVLISTTSSAPAGTSALVSIAGTRFGVTHTATQSVRFFTASLENFSPGQPGSSSTQPIVLPINGAAQSLNLRLSGNFFNPGAGAQLIFPTVTGISITPSAATAAAGDIVSLEIQAVQGAALNQTIPLVMQAQIPNMNPPVPQTLVVFVRPTSLPDLAVTSIQVAGRNFSANPWLSGEPLDFVATITNNGPGVSQGFETLHLFLNGSELTRAVTVPQALQPNTSVSVTVHVVAPDPVMTGASSVSLKVEEDAVGDANSSNDLLSVPIATSDWSIGISNGLNVGDSDANALLVSAGSANVAQVTPKLNGSGDFLTSVSVLNGIVSSRLTANAGLTSFNSTQQQIRYSISASSTAAQGFYAAQLIARFVDGGRNTAQRQVTVHVSVLNANSPGDTVTIVSSRNNACTQGCTRVEINGLLIENLSLTATRSGGASGSVDLHFTDPSSVISNVSSSGSFGNPIIKAVAYGVPTNVLFAAAQDATGAVLPGTAQVTVSATSIQTAAVRDGPTPEPVGPNQTPLQFSVGDLELSSPPCFNLAPGAQGALELSFTPLGGFNAASISWSVAALPAGVVLNSITPSSTFNGSSYSGVSVDLTNNNPVDIRTAQPLTVVGTITNNNGSASVAFAPTIQLHAGACLPGGVRNQMIEGGAGGNRGTWRRGAGGAASARSSVIESQPASLADVRLVAGEVSYTPAIPKAGETVQLRFRLTNLSRAQARDIPVGLIVNGSVVVSDTFDVGAGKTVLAGLEWVNAQLPQAPHGRLFWAALVVDPARNARATIASGKLAPLAHFTLEGGSGSEASFAPRPFSGHQRALVQLGESACVGFRFSSGAGGACGAADVEISLEDAASGVFSLASTRGISDLGVGFAGSNVASNLQYSAQIIGAAGHSYAVQLDGGRVGVLTIRSLRNPQQRAATANKVFRGGAARKLAARLGKTSEPVETGDVAGSSPEHAGAVLELLYDNP